jgi:PAS domain S-box-containing protein
MNRNEDILDREYIIPNGEVVYSTTDPSGRIKTFNRVFLEASGYAPDEITGKTHAILKHPDMPTCVYDDMWETISSGNTWSGMVKNRRKDGSYYWVDSSITPVIEDGFISGYASIRYAPTRERVKKAEEFYKQVKEKKAIFPSTKTKVEKLNEIDHRSTLTYYLVAMLVVMFLTGAAVLYSSHVEPLSWVSWVVVLSVVSMLYFMNNINKMILLEENNEVFNAIKDLSSGKFRTRFQTKSKFAPYLDLLRIRNGNMNAVMGDCEYTKSLNAAILDNILGSVVVTDYNFNITDYNLSASSTLTSDCETSELANKESHLHRLSGTNLTKFLTVNIRDILKKRETATETLCVNDNLYRTIIKAVKVREEIKGWMFVFYKIDESGNFVDVLDRRKRD